MQITPISSYKNYTKSSMNKNQKATKVKFTGEVQAFKELLQEAKKYKIQLSGSESFEELSRLINKAKQNPPKRSFLKRLFVDLEWASDGETPPGWGNPGI